MIWLSSEWASRIGMVTLGSFLSSEDDTLRMEHAKRLLSSLIQVSELILVNNFFYETLSISPRGPMETASSWWTTRSYRCRVTAKKEQGIIREPCSSTKNTHFSKINLLFCRKFIYSSYTLFSSINKAHTSLCISYTCIKQCCEGIRKTAWWYIFSYYEASIQKNTIIEAQ